jgi:chitin disaccharide deacetylase
MITDSILTCFQHGRVHTASAMVFMADSIRAAEVARDARLRVGLHLNLVETLSAENLGEPLRRHHSAVTSYLNARKTSQVLFNPFLRSSFEYVFKAQWEEFCHLYGAEPPWLDGHHHMHLCMNMLLGVRMPPGLKVRRNFTFHNGEKGRVNLVYRRIVDRWLTSRYTCSDAFFSAAPLGVERMRNIVHLSQSADVELMVHPGLEAERAFLMSDDWRSLLLETTGDLVSGERALIGSGIQ